ncbi:hypothetical protein HK102_011028, partial [Quaeritorhiza haematococci]
AAARIKTGHYREAVEDCSNAIELATTFDGFELDVPIDHTTATTDGEINNKVTISIEDRKKSLLRRATAYEALERWKDAEEDYRVLLGMDPGVRGVSLGLSRCLKALKQDDGSASNGGGGASGGVGIPIQGAEAGGQTSSNSQWGMFEEPFGGVGAASMSSSPPRPTSHAVKQAMQEAIDQHRGKEAEKEEEEALKLAYKDQTDFKLNQWRAGKEANLRALLSSLDTVLWPELGWKSIQLSELITPQQVK